MSVFFYQEHTAQSCDDALSYHPLNKPFIHVLQEWDHLVKKHFDEEHIAIVLNGHLCVECERPNHKIAEKHKPG